MAILLDLTQATSDEKARYMPRYRPFDAIVSMAKGSKRARAMARVELARMTETELERFGEYCRLRRQHGCL
jgi:hypothetical protein